MKLLLFTISVIGFVLCEEIYGKTLEESASRMANESMTQILRQMPFLDSKSNKDYTDYFAEDYFWRLFATNRKYKYFAFAFLFHKDWQGWYALKQFSYDAEDIMGYNAFADKHYKAISVAFGYLKK